MFFFQVLPSDFTYIVNNIPGKGVELPTDPILGCQCRNGCLLHLEKGKCCPGCHKGRFAYHDGLIRLKPGRPIFECNSRYIVKIFYPISVSSSMICDFFFLSATSYIFAFQLLRIVQEIKKSSCDVETFLK